MMTSHLDSGASYGGHAATEQPDPTGGEREGKRLRQQVDDRDTALRLARRLTGQGLPDVELLTLRAGEAPLRAHVAGWVAIEFFPGQGPRSAPEFDAEQQMAAIRAHADHAEGFRDLAAANTRTLSVISDPPAAIDLTATFIDPHGLVLCDPDLLIAGELALPKIEVDGVQRYRRLTLLANDARIEKVIFPPDENVDKHFRRIATWIRATRG